MFFLQNKSIKLIASPIMMLSVLGLSACHRGPVMHSQSQVTNKFESGYSLFGTPNPATPAPVNTTKPSSSASHSANSGSANSQMHMVKSTPLTNMSNNNNNNNNNTNSNNKTNKNNYIRARNIKDVKVKYVPVPIPGQLMPIQKHGAKQAHNTLKQAKPPTAMQVVNLANNNARVKPTDQGYFNSVMTYEYMPGAVYVVYTAPMNITDIMFEPGEKIISYPSGDTTRWKIAKTRSGSGDTLREHLIIKPQKKSLENTLLVTTDKRVYHLQLFSTHNNTYMVAVSWNYPEDFFAGPSMPSDSSYQVGAMLNNTLTLDIANLKFNYQFGMLKGDKPNWFPLRVFSSDRQTFIEFGKEFKSSDLPILYIKTDNGQYATMINWRLLGRFMVIDQVVSQAQLVMGVKKNGQTIVLIEQTK